VPQKYADIPRLGSWVSNQRKGYKNFKSGDKACRGMFKEIDKIQQLVNIGFWCVSEFESEQQTWNAMHEHLKQYIK